jgi:lysozyme family protein
MFEQLYSSVMKNELGYNPNDQGAPTYNGIWSKAWPNWEGWKIINAIPNKKRGDTFYKEYPQLESMAKNFYRTYWAPLQVDKLNNLTVAQMLADISTQHGGWRKIINAGVNGGNALKAAAVYNTDTIEKINSNPALYYKQIAEARLFYSTNVQLSNEADRKGIINRANKYIKIAASWVTQSPGKTGGAAVLTALLFFF